MSLRVAPRIFSRVERLVVRGIVLVVPFPALVYIVYPRRWKMERIVIWALVSLLVWGMGVAGLIVFGTSKPPPAAAAITGPFSAIG
jgi:hypothetical protein